MAFRLAGVIKVIKVISDASEWWRRQRRRRRRGGNNLTLALPSIAAFAFLKPEGPEETDADGRTREAASQRRMDG